MFTREEAEGRRLRHPFDTVTEGIGLNRLTANFARARIDGAFQGTDREAVQMVSWCRRAGGGALLLLCAGQGGQSLWASP